MNRPALSLALVPILASSAIASNWSQWRGDSRNGKLDDGIALRSAFPDDKAPQLWKSDAIPSGDDGGHGSPVVSDGHLFLSVVWHRDVPTPTRTIDSLVMRKFGNGKVALPEPVLAKLEEDRLGLSPRMRGGKLNEWIDAWIAENLDEEQKAKFDWWVKGRFKAGRKAIGFEDLEKLTAVKDKIFPDHAALTAWAEKQDFAPGVKDRVLAAVPDTKKVAEDVVVAIDTASGKEVWRFESQGEPTGRGSSSTPTVAGDLVYATGSTHLFCVDRKSGKERWRAELPAKGGKGSASSPLVGHGIVAVLAGSLQAFDAATGEKKWEVPQVAGKTGSPVFWKGTVVCNGRKNLVAVDPETGEIAWETHGGGDATPAVDGDYLVTPVKTKPAGLYCYRWNGGDKPEEAWKNLFLTRRYASSPVIDGEVVYYLGSDRHLCIDLKDGAVRWQESRNSTISSPLMADGKLFVYENKAKYLTAVGAVPGGYESSGRVEVRAMPCPSPVIAEGKLFVRVDDGVACYDLSQKAVQP